MSIMRTLFVLALALLAFVGLAIGDASCPVGERGCTRDKFLNATEYYKLLPGIDTATDPPPPTRPPPPPPPPTSLPQRPRPPLPLRPPTIQPADDALWEKAGAKGCTLRWASTSHFSSTIALPSTSDKKGYHSLTFPHHLVQVSDQEAGVLFAPFRTTA
jgi:hypothetical protein